MSASPRRGSDLVVGAAERAALIAECTRREAAGLMIPIVIRRAVAPRGRRVRVARGLMGEPVSWHDGRLVCHVDPATLRALLTGYHAESLACRLAKNNPCTTR